MVLVEQYSVMMSVLHLFIMQLYLKGNKSFILIDWYVMKMIFLLLSMIRKEQKIKKEEGILSLKVILMESTVY